DQPGGGVSEPLGRQLEAGLAADLRRAEQPCLRQRGELLRHCLPRHRQLGGELRRGGAAARGDRRDERAPPRVAEGVEDRVYAYAAVHASAYSSSAAPNCGDVSTTWTRVPPSTCSSSTTTSPPSSQSSTSRS